jgi:hypothetical protein
VSLNRQQIDRRKVPLAANRDCLTMPGSMVAVASIRTIAGTTVGSFDHFVGAAE